MAEQYISLNEVRDRIAAHPMLQGVTTEAVIRYSVSLMRIVGVPNIFDNKVAQIHCENHKFKLPCDYIRMIQMRGKHGVYRKATDTFFRREPNEHDHCAKCPALHKCTGLKKDANGVHAVYNSPECVAMIHSMVPMPAHSHGNFYAVQGGIVKVSHREDNIEMSYLAIKTDGEGYPMIPDDEKFVRALEAYIKEREFTILYDCGRLQQDILQNARQEYAWAVGAAQSSMHELDLPGLEAVSNAMHGMINKNNNWDSTFSVNGSPTYMRKH